MLRRASRDAASGIVRALKPAFSLRRPQICKSLDESSAGIERVEASTSSGFASPGTQFISYRHIIGYKLSSKLEPTWYGVV